MITAEFLIKDGTCGWRDYDGCDLCLQTIKKEDDKFVVPPIGSKVVINTKDNMNNKYLVNDVEIYYGDALDIDFKNTYVRIYVLEYDVAKHIGDESLKERIERWNNLGKNKKK